MNTPLYYHYSLLINLVIMKMSIIYSLKIIDIAINRENLRKSRKNLSLLMESNCRQVLKSKSLNKVNTLYNMALPLAWEMMKNNETHMNVAIIGRLQRTSVAAVYSQVLIGNAFLGLDSDIPGDLAHMKTIECTVVVIDMKSLYRDVDLRPYKPIKKVYIIGNSNFNVKLPENAKTVNFDEKSISEDQYKEVVNFEKNANKSKITSYNFSSGSTGPPKCQIFKNQERNCLLLAFATTRLF